MTVTKSVRYDIVFKHKLEREYRVYRKGEAYVKNISKKDVESYMRDLSICYGHGLYDYFDKEDFNIIEVTKTIKKSTKVV